jgi:hypothetical protein
VADAVQEPRNKTSRDFLLESSRWSDDSCATQADLLQVVDALGTPRCFPCLLDRRQQERDEHGDDRDHHQELDQGERSSRHASSSEDVTRLKKRSTKNAADRSR